jgi:c(7)-type cytochrome triheme protein
MIDGTRSKQLLKAILVFGAIAIFAASCIKQEQRMAVPLTSAETPDPIPERASSKTFESFSHKIPEHTQFSCNSCHQREANGVKSKLGGHESCIGCHLNQFVDEDQIMCSICHTDTSSSDPPVKAFPVKFIEGFNTKFDHGDHNHGEGLPTQGCSACHDPSGRGKTIPSGFQAHAQCYVCHTAEKKIGSCGTCHQVAPYTRTLPSQYSPRIIFSHNDHAGQRCNECHKVNTGAPQSQQVTNIETREHLTTPGFNCLKCHNGRRAFTGNVQSDVRSCTRCHRGPGFGALPPGTYSGVAEEAPEEN